MAIVMRGPRSFLARLSSFRMDGVFNPWAESDSQWDRGPSSSIDRLANLTNYLNQTKDAKILLIGEAPGFNGAKFSGVAFTDECFPGDFPELGLEWLKSTSKSPGRWREPSARVMWGVIGERWRECRMWNAFACHPHEPGNLLSNRAPKKSERLAGRAILDQFIQESSPQTILAVGKVAMAELSALNIKAEYVRHPSYGGAEKCRQGLRGALNIPEPEDDQLELV